MVLQYKMGENPMWEIMELLAKQATVYTNLEICYMEIFIQNHLSSPWQELKPD